MGFYNLNVAFLCSGLLILLFFLILYTFEKKIPLQQKSKRMKQHLFIVLLLLAPMAATWAQNAIDAEGRKTGNWKVYYPEGDVLRYEGCFEKGKPVGSMKRYNEKGGLEAELNFYPGSDRCHAKMYHTNGNLKARGVYQGQLKDSVWLYFGSGNTLRLMETYQKGELSGWSESYYQTGSVAQRVFYTGGQRHGIWLWLYENGDTMQVAHYSMGMLDGAFRSFSPEGNPEVTGQYTEDLMDGDWEYFDEEGVRKSVLHYDHGTLLNPEVLEKGYEEFIQHVEENMNNMPDPAVDL
jgi:antitoxin component YwqK of YwqJK toxin-antitoxin module